MDERQPRYVEFCSKDFTNYRIETLASEVVVMLQLYLTSWKLLRSGSITCRHLLCIDKMDIALLLWIGHRGRPKPLIA